MKIRKIALNPYIDADILDDIFKGSGDTSTRDDPGAGTAGAGVGDEAKASDKPLQSKGPRSESKAATALSNNYNNQGRTNNNNGDNSDDDDGEGIGEELDEEIADDEDDNNDGPPPATTNTMTQSRTSASQPKSSNTYNNNNSNNNSINNTNNRSDSKAVPVTAAAPQTVKVMPNNRFRDDDSEGSGGIGEELDEVIQNMSVCI